MNLRTITNNLLYNVLFVVFAGVLGYIAAKNIWFLINYSQHGGYNREVLGWPTPFIHSFFYSIFWLMGFIGFILLIFRKHLGWIIIQVLAISGASILLFVVIRSIFTPLDYFNFFYLGLLASIFILIVVLNNNFVIGQLMIKKKSKIYAKVLIGILVLGITAITVFMIRPY